MNPERILLRLGQRAAKLTASRSPAVARAAKRARAATATVRHAVRVDVDARLLVAAALEAMVILQALESRDRRRRDRKRGRRLASVAHVPARKASDADIERELAAAGGRVRRAARALGVAPSTITRRNVAQRDATQHPVPYVSTDVEIA